MTNKLSHLEIELRYLIEKYKRLEAEAWSRIDTAFSQYDYDINYISMRKYQTFADELEHIHRKTFND